LPKDDFVVNGHISKATYYRLYLGSILPSTIDSVLYLDTDLLVVSNNFNELFDINIKDYPLAAVNHYTPNERLRLGLNGDYFQAGVLLINLKFWRENSVEDSFLDVLQTRSKDLLYWDQDILNIVFDSSCLVLPDKYNVHLLLAGVADVVIYHFDGTRKPWRLRNDRPGKKEWLEIARHVRKKYYLHFWFHFFYKRLL